MIKPLPKPFLANAIRVALIAGVATMTTTTICNVCLVTASVLSLIHAIQTKKLSYTVSIIPIPIFILFLISFAYSSNVPWAFHLLELWSSYLFIPLIFLFAGDVITDTFVDQLLIVFASAISLFCAWVYCVLVFKSGNFTPANQEETAFSYEDPFSRVGVGEITQIHPSYLSVFILFAMVIIVVKFRIHWSFRALLVGLLFLFMLLLSAKNQIGLFFIVVPLIIWTQLKISWKMKAAIIAGVVIIALVAGARNDQVRYRFREELGQTLGERLILWEIGWNIIKEEPVLGVGAGDHGDLVNTELKKRKLYSLIGFNLHNQYLDIWMMLGVVGLAFFLVMIGFGFRTGNFMFCCLLLIMCLSMLTESMMYRQKGLVFFLLFYGCFGNRYFLRKESPKTDAIVVGNA